ncbi:hypothetical protein [Halodesulfurarchaeum sp.]|uniref:hypothetical protein n=1 Tax=Halodesulfurarchaeum sp. TaxID=1980530 RepID=UPI002FC3BAF9
MTEYDLRGETPIELGVAGLSDTEIEPSIRYKGHTFSPDMDSFTIQCEQISFDHLPRVEDGETETLELVTRTGDDEFHVYDSVEIEYRQATPEAEESEDSGGGGSILGGIADFFGGGDSEESASEESAGDNTETTTEGQTPTDSAAPTPGSETEDGSPDQQTTKATESDDGGFISFFKKMLGL